MSAEQKVVLREELEAYHGILGHSRASRVWNKTEELCRSGELSEFISWYAQFAYILE